MGIHGIHRNKSQEQKLITGIRKDPQHPSIPCPKRETSFFLSIFQNHPCFPPTKKKKQDKEIGVKNRS